MAPLDWGLGHATRCIPVIQELQQQGAEVMIAADGAPLDLLKREFPELAFVKLPGYNITYPKTGSMAVKMLLQLPKILKKIREEHYLLKEIIRTYHIDAVISDNRYGLWSDAIPSVFITHQLMVKMPLLLKPLERITFYINKYLINKYAYCWIPDVPGEENLSGDLAHKFALPPNATFIGHLSRFEKKEQPQKWGLLVLISGPEPQRTAFERIVLPQVMALDVNVLVVRGLPGDVKEQCPAANIKIMNHLPAKELNEAMLASQIILSRAGYSTIMDLAALGKKAILVPTPEQTEQEYLAKRLGKKNIFYIEQQSRLDLKNALVEVQKTSGITVAGPKNYLKEQVSLSVII